MGTDDELSAESMEVGSDELLSDDNLRLPESANTLVRLHAIRAWLTRRQQETSIEIGEAALTLQQLSQEEPQGGRLHRSKHRDLLERQQHTQRILQETQQRLKAYEEAEALFEECISHTTTGERVLVEYYLSLDELLQNNPEISEGEHLTWRKAIADVQHRIERVGPSHEE